MDFLELKFLDLLPVPQERNHFLGVDSGGYKLRNRHLVFRIKGLKVVVDADLFLADVLMLLAVHMVLVGLSELRVDDCHRQVEQEEGADEDQRQEVEEDGISVGFLHLLLYIAPALQGHRLENAQQRVHHVIEVGYTEVWVLVGSAAEVAAWTLYSSAQWLVDWLHHAGLDAHAPFHEVTRHKVGSCNGKNGEEKQQDDDGVSQNGHCLGKSLHEDFETFD